MKEYDKAAARIQEMNTHECRTEVRLGTNANGTLFAAHQCLLCGRRREAAKPRQHRYAPRFDDGLRDAWETEREEQYALLRHYSRQASLRRSKEWWDRYSEYLDSPEWAERRERRLKQDRRKCQACLAAPAVHVHHLTYDNVFNEFMFELMSVCKPCHDRIHGFDTSEPRNS